MLLSTKYETLSPEHAGGEVHSLRSSKECRMKVAALALVLLCIVPCLAFGAQIYGTLRESNRPVGPNVPVDLDCNNNRYPTKTDNYGSYKLYARETTKCTLTVTYKGSSPSTPVVSYDDPAHYDFDLIRQPDGKYQLQRR
jgi:hypothetical protein